MFRLPVCAQNNPIDSILTLLKTVKEDTNKVKLLTVLSKKYIRNNPQEAYKYAHEASDLSQKIHWEKGVANANMIFGVFYRQKSIYDSSLISYNNAIAVFNKLKDSFNLARCYGNMANVYADKGAKTKSIEYYFKALDLYEKYNSKDNIANTLSNIGITYSDMSDNDKALKYFYKAIKAFQEAGIKDGLGTLYGNIGLIYTNKNNYDSAIYYFSEAKKIDEQTDDKQDLAVVLGNIGNLYVEKGLVQEGIASLNQAIKLSEEVEDVNHLALNYQYLGKAYLELYKANKKNISYAKENLSNAINVLHKGIQLSIEVEALDALLNCYKYISQAYQLSGNINLALDALSNYVVIDDSIYSVDNKVKIAELATQREEELKEKQVAINKIVLEKKKNEQIFFAIGIGLLCVILIGLSYSRNTIKKEKNTSEKLLLNILPQEVAEELKAKGEAEAKLIDDVTVLFTDFKGFTQLSEKLTAKELVSEINHCFSAFDNIMHKHGVEKIKTIGDAYMAAGGLPIPNKTHAEDVVKAALEIQRFMHELKAKKEAEGKLFFELRIGIHTGPVVAGIVGVKKFAYDIWGDTVNTASRMESSGEVGKINISETTYALIKDQFSCTHRGKVTAKGKGEIDMYFVD
jgi:class 3 adenylate cyclase